MVVSTQLTRNPWTYVVLALLVGFTSFVVSRPARAADTLGCGSYAQLQPVEGVVVEPATRQGECVTVTLAPTNGWLDVVGHTYTRGVAGEESSSGFRINAGETRSVSFNGTLQIWPESWEEGNGFALPRPTIDVDMNGRTWRNLGNAYGLSAPGVVDENLTAALRAWPWQVVTGPQAQVAGEGKFVWIAPATQAVDVRLSTYNTGEAGEKASVGRVNPGQAILMSFNGNAQFLAAPASCGQVINFAEPMPTWQQFLPGAATGRYVWGAVSNRTPRYEACTDAGQLPTEIYVPLLAN